MKNGYVYHPVRFFFITFLITWISWFTSAITSHQENGSEIIMGLGMIVGLFSPLIAALYMVYSSKNKNLRQDFKNKLINPKLIKAAYLPFVLLFMPLVMVVSILLSVPLGLSIDQLNIVSEFRIMDGKPFISLLIPFLAPALEELGWSGYGIDSLRSKSNILTSTLIFAVLWSFWHFPLFFIKGYYHYNLLEENIWYAVNFFISVIPLTIITNWLYFKNNRSIIVAMVFHAIVVVSCEIFMVENFTKCIVTGVITIIAVAIIILDKKFFLQE